MKGADQAHQDRRNVDLPSPKRYFQVGQATDRVLKDNPWRVVLMTPNSGSHRFLTEKCHRTNPDLKTDRILL